MRYHLSEPDKKRLREFRASINESYDKLIGFPLAVDFSAHDLKPLWHYMLNNVGDPYGPPRNSNHSKVFEQEVIAFFAELFRGKPEEIWGYVTNGGTEGNLYSLYAARELYPQGVVYYSSASHYSIAKCVHMLGMRSEVVEAQPSGEIDYAALQNTLNPDVPAILVANIGTTMEEAKDDITKMRRTLETVGIKQSFIHCDGALAASYAALLEPHHPFDFADGADSISTSGHKFIGSPMPCGIVLIRKAHQLKLGKTVEYIGVNDTTVSGSRNGHLPVLIWGEIRKYGREGLCQRALKGLKLADYTYESLKAMGWPTWRNPNALTVMLAMPPVAIADRWQLAIHRGWAHIICMPGLKKRQIDGFLKELRDVTPPSYDDNSALPA